MAYLRPREGADGRRCFDVVSPVDGSALPSFEVANAADVAAAIERARAAQTHWGRTTPAERGAQGRRLLEVLLRRKDDVIRRLTAETGRPEMDTLLIEIFASCDVINFYSRRAEKILADQRVGLHLLRMKRGKVVYKPLGVVGVISPWNGPFILSMNPTIQAVLAGNAVILKPSEVTPEAGRLIEELFAEAGFPQHLVQTLLGDGETGAALIDGGIDKVTFTGSVATGRKIGEACGRNLIPCTLELGGKDPMIVLDDADMVRAAGGAVFGGMMNTGQFCMGVERVYVMRSVADEFTAKVVAKVKEMEYGRDYGPFISEAQIDIVERHVNEAVAAGATVLVGGKREGNTFQPTVVTNVTADMALMAEETFGPVLPIVPVDSVDEAVRLANSTDYGLCASVWTGDPERGERIGRLIESGSVMINETAMTYGALEVPFGGVKSSGLGQTNGADSLRRYCHAFPIISDRFLLKEESVWFPYLDDKTAGIKKALGVIWGSPLKRFM